VFLSYVLPLCQRIDVTLSPLYIRTIVSNSIITSDWKFNNFASLADGVLEAYQNLMDTQQLGSAEYIAKSFYHWWHKLAQMPSLLSKEDCFAIYAKIKIFSDKANVDMAERRWRKLHTNHVLTLVSAGDFEAAYEKMKRAQSLESRLPKHLIKLIDVVQYFAYSARKLRH
jgi:hypothetical protein